MSCHPCICGDEIEKLSKSFAITKDSKSLFIIKINPNKLYTVKEKNTRENYIRVTNVLYPFSGLDKIDVNILAYAAERGTKVHKICEGIIHGLGELGVEDETRGYVESFKKWWNMGHEVILMEERFWDDDLKLTGQVDLIIQTPEGLAIVDLKTSSKPSPTWQAQGCAYAYLAKKAGYDIQKIYFLHLNKAGRDPKLYEYSVDDSFLLAIYRVWVHFFQKTSTMQTLIPNARGEK